MEKLSISPGNSKMGPAIPSVSLPAVYSCVEGAPCINDCYDRRSYGRWPSVEKARHKNFRIYTNSRADYFNQIIGFLEAKRKISIQMFRWHVGGDIIDQDYLNYMDMIAWLKPKIKFLCFTKRHDLDFEAVVPNLSIVASMWPGWGDPEKVSHLPRAWMQDGTETRIPEDAITCSGGCQNCGMCWDLKNLGRDVVFNKH